MSVIALTLSLTALLFALSGFILGLLGYIQAKATEQSTHTVHMEAPPQQDLSQLVGDWDTPIVNESQSQDFEIPTNKLEETLLRGLE